MSRPVACPTGGGFPILSWNGGESAIKRIFLIAAVVALAAAALAHWYFGDRGRFTTEPEYTGLARTVSGNDLISDHDPAATLRFDPAYRYIGGQKFILYGVADTEQHFFVETTADDKLESVYWVQYEAYLPNKRYTYNYDDSPLQVTLGRLCLSDRHGSLRVRPRQEATAWHRRRDGATVPRRQGLFVSK